MMEILFAVRLDAALKVRRFRGEDSSVFRLSGVHIRKANGGGAICEATDYHRLAMQHDPHGVVYKNTIVAIPKAARKARGTSRNWLVGARDDDGHDFIAVVRVAAFDEYGSELADTAANAIARIDRCTMRFGDTIIEGVFPDVERAIPKAASIKHQVSFNWKYLASFGYRRSPLVIAGDDPISAHVIRDGNDPLFFGLIMPIKLEMDLFPDWLGVEPEKKEEAA